MTPLKVTCMLAFVPALALAQSSQQQTTQPREKCVVTGRVTNALTGEPIKKAEVHLDFANRQNQMSGPRGYGGKADTGGNFRFEGVEPGEYALTADRPGFLYSSYGSKAPNQPGTHLALAPGQQMSDLNIALFPEAVISGRVVDEDGDPVQGMVQVFALTWKHGKQRLQPRAQSRFRMGGSELPAIPGKADIQEVRTFFPDATSLDSAAPIQVQVGQDLTGMDIRLRALPTYHVRGRIAGVLQRTNPESLSVAISPKDSGFMYFFGGDSVTKKGTFDLGNVATGSYTLNLYSHAGSFQVVGSLPVEVAGSDVNGVIINVIPAGTLRGRIQIEGGSQNAGDANPSSVQVELQPGDEAMRGWQSAYPKQDGTFTLDSVDPGKYDLRLFPLPEGTYIKSVQLGQQEMLGKEFDFTQGVSGELLVTLSYGVAEVDGTVQMPSQDSSGGAPSNQPATAASIVLVPEELRPDGSGFEYGNPTQTGTFSIKNVAPGRYHAYAFEEMKRDQMDNPDFLKQIESKGVEVELKENDKKQVQLNLTPAADTQKILAQLGIEGQ